MKAIQKALKSIINFFEMVYEFISTIVSSTIELIGYIGDMVVYFKDLVLTLPDWLQGFALIVVTGTVVYLIVGRNTGKSG